MSVAPTFGAVVNWLSSTLPAQGVARSSITARLALIVIAIALPLNVLIIGAIWHLTREERQAQETSLLFTAQSIAAAVDAQLGKYMALAETLSRSPTLLESNLDAFAAEARRAFVSIDEAWILVADLDGQQLLNTSRQASARLPIRHHIGLASQRKAIEARSVIVSDILSGNVAKDWVAAIDVPVFKDGQPFRALAVSMSARAFLRLLNEQSRPVGWVFGIIDTQGRFVARVPDHDQRVGQLASDGWRKVLGSEGVFEFNSLEGLPLVQANARSRLSGWSVGIGVPKAELQKAAWRTTGWVLFGGGTISIASLLLAVFIGRSITRPISELRQNASVLLGSPRAATVSGPPEILELGEALRNASEERDRSEAELRQLADRFTAAEEAAVGFIFEWDVAKDDIWYSQGMARLLGHNLPQPLTRKGWHSQVHPDDLTLLEPITNRQLTPEGRFILEYRVKHRDGRWIWIWHRGQILRGPDGSMRRMIGSVMDISERKRFEAELARQNAEIAAIYDTAPIGLCVFDRDLRFTRINKRLAEMNGIPADDHLGRTPHEVIPALGDVADRLAAEIIQTGKGIENFEITGETPAQPGITRYWVEHWVPLRDQNGEITGINVVADEVTERKRADEQVRLLMQEVNHRSKNMLSIVQVIARQTAASVDPAEFIGRFSDRLQALAASQDLLVSNDWKGVQLRDLVRTQLAHFVDLLGTRVVVEGPDLRLRAQAAQGIGMALHELATNAGKYGALSVEGGQVGIRWRVAFDELHLSWEEFGGPPVTKPTRTGFGHTVIARMAAASVHGSVDLEYAPSGLTWRLRCKTRDALG